MKKNVTIILFLFIFGFSKAQSWLQLATIPGLGRDAANSFVINGKIYLGGGSVSGGGALNSFYEYDPATDVWTAKANVPDNLGGSACFTLNGKGYVVSGQNNSGVVASVYQYDPVLDQWNTMSNFLGPARLDCLGFTIGDTGYVFGGFPGGSELNDLWAYNQGNDSWEQKTSMPSIGRSGPGGFVINGIAYIGLGEYNSSANYPSDMYSYNPITDRWDSIAQFPGTLRNNALSFTIGGLGYLGMGNFVDTNTGTDSLFTNFYQYNPTSNTWAPSISFSGQGRGNGVCQQIGDTVFLGSGVGAGSNYLTDWWRNTNYPTEIKNIDLSPISIYPNPLAGGAWTLSVSNALIGNQYEITDDRGRVVYSSQIESEKSRIDLNVSDGVYFLRINSETDSLVLKLVKL